MANTKHFSRMNYHVQRGMREVLSHRILTEKEWQFVKEFFDNKCAFCGCEDTGNPRTGIVPDHLIPVVHHGETCLGNIVPSCQDCNDQRGKNNWRDYLRSEFGDEAQSRIDKIDEYLSKHPYQVSEDPHEYLTDEESAEYLKILNDWDIIWQRARKLRDKINSRRTREKT